VQQGKCCLDKIGQMSSNFLAKTVQKKKYFKVWMKQDGVSWCFGILGALSILAFWLSNYCHNLKIPERHFFQNNQEYGKI